MPDFSVIIPTRNRPAMLRRALRSVADQRGAGFEIIVADDGDGTGAAAAQALLGARPMLLHTGGRGQVPARNMAVERATGRWIAFLDDDDWWASADHLAHLAAALAAGAGLSYASGRIVREDADGTTGEEIGFAAAADARSIRRDNTLLISGIAYGRDLHRALGAFDESLPVYWDWDWYLRLTEAGIRFAASAADGVRISARSDNVSAPSNEAVRREELGRLCTKHGLAGITLKNHEAIAREQQAAGR